MGDGVGELSLFFDGAASEETRFQFEAFIEAHLRRRWSCRRPSSAAAPTAARPAASRCPSRPSGASQARFIGPTCAGGDGRVSLRDGAERLTADRAEDVANMDRSADLGRDRAVAASLLQGKIETRDFDVFGATTAWTSRR